METTEKKKTNIVTSREFRDHLKDYLDLAGEERVIVTRGKRSSFLLVPIGTEEETELFFSDPQILEKVMQGIKEAKEGKTRKVSLEDINVLLTNYNEI